VPSKTAPAASSAAAAVPGNVKPAGPTVNISRGKTVETVVIEKK
jgi:hypothetical protein